MSRYEPWPRTPFIVLPTPPVNYQITFTNAITFYPRGAGSDNALQESIDDMISWVEGQAGEYLAQGTMVRREWQTSMWLSLLFDVFPHQEARYRLRREEALWVLKRLKICVRCWGAAQLLLFFEKDGSVAANFMVDMYN